MKKLILLLLVLSCLSLAAFAQTSTPTNVKAATETKTKKPIFRATKDQITQAQKILKTAETGKMDDAFRAEVKKFQSANGLKATGTLNRATLEKMNVTLTDKQKESPVDPNSFASPDSTKTTNTTKKPPVFRATKEQIMAAQKILKEKNFYNGDENGKLDDATREGLKKYQEANGLKITGTLNQSTLEKMGVALTDKQKENSQPSSS
jgi:peptidoglycan hydrolase-like protein with peptidoglycan-binding domain